LLDFTLWLYKPVTLLTAIYCSIPFFSFFDNLILYYLRRIRQRTFLPSYSFSFFLHSYTVHSLLLFYYINPCILPCKNNKNSIPDFFSNLKSTSYCYL
ncbi:hypothetical protein SERLA73DRAFT_192374, partial [Serpula lacrymans var. lacrymans S7.3]